MGTAIPREYTSFKTLELVGKVELRSRKIAIVHVTITRNDETTATAEIYATSESGDETGQKIVLNSNPVFKLSGKVWNGWMQIFSGAYLDEGGTPRQIQLSLGWEQETDRPNSPPHAGSDLGSQILPFTN